MKHLQKTLIGLFTALNFMCLNAQNPIIQTSFTPDPAPMVYNDTVYLYTGEDAEGATYFTMPRWRVYSSTDMVNWTDLGSPLSCKDFDWTVENTAWASQCIERNGKFYWYVCCEYPGKWHTVTVAVADHPAGPYKDVLGKPLVGIGEVGEIDPTVYIDDDGQAYLYWGNNKLQYVLLNEDMISYDETVGVVDVIPLGTYSDNKPVSEEMLAAFGPKFEEGPWFYKRDNLYYMLYAAGGVPEDLSYSVSESPVGPWVYKGKIMPVGDMNKSFTNHCGVIDFKGNSYFFYHTGGLPGGGGFSRSTCVEQFEYNDDGTIPQISITKYGVKNSVGEINPYERVEGETIAWSVGLKTKGNVETGVCVTNISNNDYIKVRDVNFGETGPSVFKAYVASGVTNSEIELRIGSVTGEIIGTLPVSYTGGVDMWMLRTATVKSVTGIQDLYLIFKGDVQVSNLFDLDYWMFEEKNDVKELISINASADKYKLDLSEGLNSAGFIVTANYSDGTSEDITSAVAITPNINDIATVENGKIVAHEYGKLELNVSYNDKTDLIKVNIYNFEDEVTLKTLELEIDNPMNLYLMNGNSISCPVTAVYLDGHTEDISKVVDVTFSDENTGTYSSGVLYATGDGVSNIAFSYKSAGGDIKSVSAKLSVETFPLSVAKGFDTNIWDEGSIDEEKTEITTGQWGFCGWNYENGVDLSKYNYLVVELKSPQTCSASFRIFDESSYWSQPYFNEFGSNTKLTIDLQNMQKGENKNDGYCDPSHIYIMGFWSWGGSPIKVNRIFLSDDGENMASGVDVIVNNNIVNEKVDVVTLTGIRIKSGVTAEEAVVGLPVGIYIIGKQKVIITK